ncbi:MAG: hypothetical protein AB1Z23_11890 [Eubacteriales bacterium]
MEYLIKNNNQSKGKEQRIYNSKGDLLLTMSERLSSISGKEAIYNKSNEIVYLIDTFQQKGHFQSTIYDAKSKEILTVYLSNKYSGLNLYVSSINNMYSVTHTLDMEKIHIHRDGEVVATLKMKKSLFSNNYVLDVNPYQDEEFLQLFSIVITKLLESKSEELLALSNAY